MRQLLKPHPGSRGLAAVRVEAAVDRSRANRLVLTYTMTGPMSDIRLPPVTAPARAGGLWRHTCFEAFIRALPGTAYYEFNFAPSTEWAAYRFDGYRSGVRPAETGAPQIEVRRSADAYALQAALELDRVPDLSREASWRLGLSAVIEDTGGDLSYWALSHPPGKPDFHHADGFALEFSPAVPS